jgi:hypothetical protein
MHTECILPCYEMQTFTFQFIVTHCLTKMSLFIPILHAMKYTVGKVGIYLTLQVIKCGPKTLSPVTSPKIPTEN